MTNYTITPATSFITPLSIGIGLIQGDVLNLLPGSYIGTTDPAGTGIAMLPGTATTKINIDGALSAGKSAVYFSANNNTTCAISVGTTGSIFNSDGPALHSVNLSGGQTLKVTNHGLIHVAGGNYAIRTEASNLTVTNFGTIAGESNGGTGATLISAVGNFGFGAVTNRGVIEGGILLSSLSTSSSAFFENTGTVNGTVQVGTGLTASTTAIQHGTINGALTVSSKTLGFVSADLSHGTVTGSVTIFAGSNTTVNFIGGTFDGGVFLNGDYVWTLRLQDAHFNAGLRLANSAQNVDLTGAAITGSMDSGMGSDVIDMHAGRITGNLNTLAGNDLVNLSGATVTGKIDLGTGNDTLIADAGTNYAFNDTGDDDFDLGAGDDTLFVGLGSGFFDGNDTFEGGLGRDTISLARVLAGMQTDGVFVSLAEGMLHDVPGSLQNLFGQDEINGFENVNGTALSDLIYGDAQANRLTGLAGNDYLSGDAGADSLRGGDGNDTLIGGAGRDFLEGGAGADVFQFLAASDTGAARASRDGISDFQVGTDKISVVGIDANTTVAGLQTFVFMGNVATSGAGTVRYGYDHGDTLIQFNLDAGTAAEFTILLRGILTPTAADFLFI